MNVPEIIRNKRNGKALLNEEIEFIIDDFAAGNTPDYQFSAFLMAAYLNGLNKKETSALTKAMLYSGEVLNLSSIPGSKIDKHSTGGVGDKTSLILAPIVAAAGVKVPMISGRGLGHSGGTLDKLESIPGFRTDLNLKEYKKVLQKCGAVLIGQTKEIAPADKKIYALRDVTSTVESIPLITGSIMSKKLAEGIDGLVLDVKTGSGAFMKKIGDARSLALSLMNTAKAFDKKVMAFITDMNQPLGNYVGNWLEIYESILALHGEKINDLMEVTLNLSGAMIYLGGKAGSIKEGIEISKEMIRNGKAFDKFVEITKLQGGNINYLKNPERYPESKIHEKIYAAKSGYVKSIDCYSIGVASIELGAGRFKISDRIDPKAGIIFHAKIGQRVKKGQAIAEIFTDKPKAVDAVKSRLSGVIEFSEEKTSPVKMIKQILS